MVDQLMAGDASGLNCLRERFQQREARFGGEERDRDTANILRPKRGE